MSPPPVPHSKWGRHHSPEQIAFQRARGARLAINDALAAIRTSFTSRTRRLDLSRRLLATHRQFLTMGEITELTALCRALSGKPDGLPPDPPNLYLAPTRRKPPPSR